MLYFLTGNGLLEDFDKAIATDPAENPDATPGIAPIERDRLLASIAISLKRIADALDRSVYPKPGIKR